MCGPMFFLVGDMFTGFQVPSDGGYTWSQVPFGEGRGGIPCPMPLRGDEVWMGIPGRYTPWKVHPQKVYPSPGKYTPRRYTPKGTPLVLISSGSHQSVQLTGMLSFLKKV